MACKKCLLMRRVLHVAVVLIGLTAVYNTDVASESPLKGAIYPLIAWACATYVAILVGITWHNRRKQLPTRD